MANFFQKPGAAQMLMQLGAGLMASGAPRRYGAPNPGLGMIAQAPLAMQHAQQFKMQQDLYRMQKRQMEAKLAQNQWWRTKLGLPSPQDGPTGASLGLPGGMPQTPGMAAGGTPGLPPDQLRAARLLFAAGDMPGAAKAMAPREQFETVADPYGRGGVGQRSSFTGQISGYQGPTKPGTPQVVRDFNSVTGWSYMYPGGRRVPNAPVPSSMTQRARTPSSSRFQPQGPYVTKQGVFLGEGFYDKQQDKLTLRPVGGGESTAMPAGARPRTETGLLKGAMTGQQFNALASEAAEEEKSLRELTRYMSSVGSTEQGWRLLADKLHAHFNTLFGKELSPMEYRTLLQNGQLQGLLGGFRKEVVGGGVMTEIDAARVLARLGGDVSMLRNPAVATQLLQEMFEEKARRYNETLVPQYNFQRQIIPRGRFTKKEPIAVQFQRNPNAPPPIGTIETDDETGEQYEFLGGDPRDETNYRKLP